MGKQFLVLFESKFTHRILFVFALISAAAVAFHAALQADTLTRVFVPVAALFLGGIAAGFPWLAYAMHAGQKEDTPPFFVFAMRLFVCVGAIGWIITTFSMFTLDHDGGEAAVLSVSAVCLAISAAAALRRKRETNQQPQQQRP